MVEPGIDWPTPSSDSPDHGSCKVVGVSDTPTDGSVTPMPVSETAMSSRPSLDDTEGYSSTRYRRGIQPDLGYRKHVVSSRIRAESYQIGVIEPNRSAGAIDESEIVGVVQAILDSVAKGPGTGPRHSYRDVERGLPVV